MVELVQQGGPVAQEGDYLLGEATLKRMVLEAVEIGLHREMEEAIGQRRRHLKHRGAVFLAVAGRPKKPAIWHYIAADAAIEDQLLGHSLHRRRGHVELIEKQDPLALARQELRRIPGGGARRLVLARWHRHRQTAQVGGSQLAEAQIDELHISLIGHLGDDAGFADARRSPDHGADRQIGCHQLVEVADQLGGFEAGH